MRQPDEEAIDFGAAGQFMAASATDSKVFYIVAAVAGVAATAVGALVLIILNAVQSNIHDQANSIQQQAIAISSVSERMARVETKVDLVIEQKK